MHALGINKNDATSLQVYDTGCPSQPLKGHPALPCGASLYAHPGYAGWAAHFGVGDYNMGAFEDRGGVEDEMSSFKVYGGSNCCLSLYQDRSFDGWSKHYGPGNYDHGGLESGVNDNVSSLKVRSDGCPT